MGIIDVIKRYGAVKQAAVGLGLILVLAGCGAQEPLLSRETKGKVAAVQLGMARLATALTAAVAQRDIAKVDAILRENYTAMRQDGSLPIRRVGVTDGMGSILMEYPVLAPVTGLDFSKYQTVANAIRNRTISQERLYLKNRPEILLVCGPLIADGEVVGTVWISFDADQVRKTWEITTEEFLRINFNPE